MSPTHTLPSAPGAIASTSSTESAYVVRLTGPAAARVDAVDDGVVAGVVDRVDHVAAVDQPAGLEDLVVAGR